MRLDRIKQGWISAVTIALVVPSFSQPSQAGVQSPSPQVTSFSHIVDPRIVATAKEWFHRFQTGQIDRSQLDTTVNGELTSAMIEQEGAKLRQFGTPSSFRFIRTYAISGAVGYDFLLQFSAGRIVEMIAFDPGGKIAGIDFMTSVKDEDK